jgi:hypothetical protein
LDKLADEAGDMQNRLHVLSHKAWFLMQAGNLPAAAKYMESSIEGLTALPDYQVLFDVLGERVRCALWMGDTTGASRWLDEARRLLRSHFVVAYLTVPMRECAAAFELMHLEHAAQEEKPHVARRAKAAVRFLHRLDDVVAGAEPVTLRLQGHLDWLLGRQARAEGSWTRSLDAAGRLGASHLAAATHQHMGRLMCAPTHLEEALRFFNHAGFSFQEACTLRYLGEAVSHADPEAARAYFERGLAMHASMDAEHERELIQSRQKALRAGTQR